MALNVFQITQYTSTSGDTAAAFERRSGEQMSHPGGTWPQIERPLVRDGGLVFLISNSPYFQHVGTSPAMDSRSVSGITASVPVPSEPSSFQDVLTLSIADQAREVLAALALNKSQLAEVLGVSRPTLYDWFDGKEPKASNSARLTMLLRLLAREDITSSNPLQARFVRHPLHEEGPSLFDLLRADTLDEAEITSLLREARTLGKKAESRRTTREERLRALEFDEPSDEQRKDQLARNIAMRDWPKF